METLGGFAGPAPGAGTFFSGVFIAITTISRSLDHSHRRIRVGSDSVHRKFSARALRAERGPECGWESAREPDIHGILGSPGAAAPG